MLVSSGKTVVTDQKFDADETCSQFENHVFTRLVAKRKAFTNVNFKYSFFDTCYLRDCRFDSCDFTGCRFVNTNFHGAKFEGCNFDYTYFEKTFIDLSILDTECPGLENLKSRFARTLRTNFQQLGDAAGVNKAIKVELQATEAHLLKTWRSNEAYYRKKYSGWHRFTAYLVWLRFKALDYMWGNGERPLRLIITVLLILGLMTVLDVVAFRDPNIIGSYIAALGAAPEVFLGLLVPPNYPQWYLSLITVVRLGGIALFLSIVIKKLNRR